MTNERLIADLRRMRELPRPFDCATLDAAIAKLEALDAVREKARDVVMATTQDDLGRWVINGDGEELICDLREAVEAARSFGPAVLEARGEKAPADQVKLAAGGEEVAQWLMTHSLPTGHGDTISDMLDEGFAALRAQVAELAAENDRLSKLVYVPGVWQCAKCKFQLVQSTLNASSGTVTARDDPGEKCPNCDCSLWRCTYKDEYRHWAEAVDQYSKRAFKAEAQLDALCKALKPSADTKAKYMGEFRFVFPAHNDEGYWVDYTPNVPWTTIKEIMAAIRAFAALRSPAVAKLFEGE